jgi:hypothetical protein
MSARAPKRGRPGTASKGAPRARAPRKDPVNAPAPKPGRSETASKEAPRPLGARHALGTAFLEALQKHFAQYGEAAIHSVFEESPYQYLRIVAALMPKLLHLEDTTLDEMNDDDIRELLAAIRLVRARAHGAAAAGPLGPEDDPEAPRH